MPQPNVYQGRAELLDKSIAYRVESHTDYDDIAVRELTIDHAPFLPSQLLNLMKVIAPLPAFSDIRDIKADMGQVFDKKVAYRLLKV